MTNDTQIKTRPDGSIDTAHYMQIGRRMRSEQAMSMIKGGAKPAAKPEAKPLRRVFGAFRFA